MYEGRIVVPTGAVDAPYRAIRYTARTQVDAEAIAGIIRASVERAYVRALQMTANMVVSVTLPNNPTSYMSGPSTPGSYKPNKAQVNKLRKRIIKEVMGKGKPADAQPNAQGRPVLKGPRGVNGSTPLPVVTPRKYRGRPSKGRKVNQPDKVLTAPELEAWLKTATVRVDKRGKTKRVARNGQQWVWTTPAAWREVSRNLSRRAGNFIHGWEGLARLAQSKAVDNGTLPSGRYDSVAAMAAGAMDDAREGYAVEAVNPLAPGPGPGDYTKPKARYTQRVINNMLESGWERALSKALREVNPRNLRKLRGVQSYEGVTIDWA